MPIYAIKSSFGSDRLVRANNPSQALRYVARNTFGVAPASKDQIVDVLTHGGKCEDASEEPETALSDAAEDKEQALIEGI